MNKWRFFVPKLDTESGLLELFDNVTGLRFFRHSVDNYSDVACGYKNFCCFRKPGRP